MGFGFSGAGQAAIVVIPPSGDAGGTEDWSTVQAYLNGALPGDTVQLGAGQFYFKFPVTVPNGVRFCGSKADVNDIAVLGTTIHTPFGIWSQGTASQNAAFILGTDAEADTFNLNCHFANGNNMDGFTTNNLSNVRIHDINVYNGPRYGVFARGNTWRAERVMVTQPVLAGFNAPASDSEWLECNASASQAAGWILNNAINTKLTSCRAEFNTTDGYQVTGDNTATGGVTLTGCSTDRNGNNGLTVNSTGNWPVLVNGMMFRRDGSNGTGNAVNVASTNTSPVILDGITVFPGFNDNGTGTQSPVTGISIGAGAGYVSLVNALVHAVTTPVSGILASSAAVALRTGSWNAPNPVQLPVNPQQLQAATPAAGFPLVNGTPTIVTWNVPNDGNNHRASIFLTADVTVATTGGALTVNWTMPDGTATGHTLLGGTLGTGGYNPGQDLSFVCKAGTTVTVAQTSALTAGAETVWTEIWGS